MFSDELEWREISCEEVRSYGGSYVKVSHHVAEVDGGTLLRTITYKYDTGASVDVTFIPDYSQTKTS